jgi:hypothetical protein
MAGKKQKNERVGSKMHLEDISMGVKAPAEAAKDVEHTVTMLDYEGQTVTTRQAKPKAPARRSDS